ncbi:MAG: phage holin family protein, partial [Verrucomicrobia bacterium]|nr:phage holin family protein [Verrucomicrobiota bacterium]
HVAGFWPAVWGALVVSITNMVLSGFTRPARPRVPPQAPQPVQPEATPPRVKQKPDDVIDI